MITSISLPPYLFAAVSIVGAIGCYLKGDFGDFTRSLGVLVILLSQRVRLVRFLLLLGTKVRNKRNASWMRCNSS